ncbi:MAG TPA: DUF2177 family protein [Candidatus Hydrogenedentes bacterium]|nr:MAG: hypothetical protein BWY09_01556 [Candidatus Hydrogenedentes bacterium ADurb.Bin179]HOH28293.1 DUF2177 family protein [Candidatus Hydrogenedentota bacterium]
MFLKLLITWFSGMAGLLILDLFWIGFFASDFYRKQIGFLLHIEDGNMVVNIPAALATWAVIVTGIQIFALPRVPQQGPLLSFVLWGALFGAVTYAVYDLTNFAVVKNWPLAVTLVDIAWGTVVCAGTALCMGLVSRGLERWL